MKHYETKTETREVKTITKVTCDICGKEVGGEGPYDVDEVIISHEVGTNYPEGISTDTFSVDICGDCFMHKILPCLSEFGIDTAAYKPNW